MSIADVSGINFQDSTRIVRSAKNSTSRVAVRSSLAIDQRWMTKIDAIRVNRGDKADQCPERIATDQIMEIIDFRT